ncbi:glutamate receptor ionotropic, NMDA 3A-like [Mya arenaria]|nr:glutamate receptor ionotropic, NMDA 3A-like [Mya arenaria]
MMHRCILLLGTALPLFVYAYTVSPNIGSIGAVFDAADYNHFNGVFYQTFQENRLLHQSNLTLTAFATPLQEDSSIYTSFLSLCSFLQGRNFRALLVVGREETVQRVGLVAQPLGIPVIALTTDSVVERHVQAHNPLLLMLRPSQADQAKAYLQFFQANFWFNLILIVQDSLLSDGFYEQMKKNVTDASKWNINTKIIPESFDAKKLQSLATSLLQKEPKIVVIHADLSLVQRIFQSFYDANVTSLNHAWFITDSSLTRDYEYMSTFPTGTLSIVPNYAINIDDVILDGTNFLIKSVIQAPHETPIFRGCWNYTQSSNQHLGEKMFRILQSTTLTGRSGTIVFDNQGKLDASNFVVQNLVREDGQTPFWRRIGYIQGEDVSPFGIVWPGESITSQIAFGRKKYRIVTNPVKPFVMDESPHPDYGYCATETTCIYINNTGRNNIIHALEDYKNGVFNKSNPYVLKCCRGLSVDLLNRLASDLDFDYELYIVSDTTYGKEVNGSWNGMIRELMSGTAHMAVAAFSITRDRVKVIDFTSIYFFSGFSILYTEKQRASNMQAFLDPFAPAVWFAIIISATLTAIAMGIFEWNSPFGLNPWGKKRKQNYTLASGMTMVYSVLFGHTVKTKSPKAWPSKVMQNLWAFSCIFVIASYTANLAAFIAGKHAGIIYRSVHDSWLNDINVGVLPGSAVEGIVKQLNPRLWSKTQNYLVDTTDNAINKLIKGELDAYLGDYPILDYARAKLDPDCKLRLLTQTFGEDGYGIGLPKGSPLKTPLSKMINEYHESGYIEDLIDVHFADSRCYKQRIKSEDSQLEEQHHAGSFVMLCVGIVVGICVLFLEHAIFKWCVPKLRRKPGQSLWKSVHVMFFSQRLHRSINSAELVPAHETVREMLGIWKSKDFIKLFQKNTIKTNKMADAAKRKRLNRNFFDIIEKAKWMKEMQDNNLFGDESTPCSPSPQIREISLRDITQAVDLSEFRKQNMIENQEHLLDFTLPTKVKDFDESTSLNHRSVSHDGFDWSAQQSDSQDILTGIASEDPLISESSAVNDPPTINDAEEFGPFVSNNAQEAHTYTSPVFELEPSHSIELVTETKSGREHLYDVPLEIRQCDSKEKKTPNGDLFSDEYRPKRKELSFAPESHTVRRNSSDQLKDQHMRRLSIPDTKPKDSRTFHPRKRQTIHGNRRGKTSTGFNVDKFSKEELLLMWKSSELEMNERLQTAVKDKQRLETKLTALKLQMSTPV